MATPDDQSYECIGAEAERLRKELDRRATSGGASGQDKTARNSSYTNTTTAAPATGRTMNWPVLGLAVVAGAVLSALVIALVLQFTNNRHLNRAQTQAPQRNSNLAPASPSIATGTEPSQSTPGSATDSNPSASSPAVETSRPQLPSQDTPPIQKEVPRKGLSQAIPAPPATTSGAWGPASAYKFGRLPDSSYPNSCAFSQTDLAGQTILSRSTLDYWACRDEGGNSSDGYSVAWADGKRTKYKFGPGGDGSVIGTNGILYRVRWRNALRNGNKVIIIDHQDGAISWIPGQVD